jgi:hypothetical protein
LFSLYQDASNYWLVLYGTGADIEKVYAVQNATTATNTPTSAALSVGWHHACWTWNSGGHILYVDGVATGAAVALKAFPTVTSMGIGENTGGTSQANSLICDLCILDRALSADEVYALYTSNAPAGFQMTPNELMLTGAGLGKVKGNALGLFGYDASGNEAFALATGAVAWGTLYAAGLAAGDLVLGDPDVGGHLYYDASAGTLNFRNTAGAAQVTVDVSGWLTAGAGAVVLNADGARVMVGSDYAASGGYVFGNISAYPLYTVLGGMYAKKTLGSVEIKTEVPNPSGFDAKVHSLATTGTGKEADVIATATSLNDYTTIRAYAKNTVESYGEVSGYHLLTGDMNDGHAGGLVLVPLYTGDAPTRTLYRHNYLKLDSTNIVSMVNAILGNACVFEFDAAIGTHPATDAGSTKASPGTVSGWMKMNVNGTIYYSPLYTSKTS